MESLLLIQDFSIMCHLGCTPDEREQVQEVRVSVKIEFAEKPVACTTDELSDTVCYAVLCGEMKEAATAKNFKTVEHLAQEIRSRLSRFIPNGSKCNLSLHKVNPPIDGLKGGVHFQILEN